MDMMGTTEKEDFYGSAKVELEKAEEILHERIEEIRSRKIANGIHDPAEHYKSRIKSVESITEKLVRKGLECTREAALTELHDILGIRVVCTFVDDVYIMAQELKKSFTVKDEKDYIRFPKPNGYRSLHLILELPAELEETEGKLYAEVQLRTIAMDCWASLEHQLKYKKIIKNQELIVSELKRCADEMASTDLTMQTIRELIDTSQEN